MDNIVADLRANLTSRRPGLKNFGVTTITGIATTSKSSYDSWFKKYTVNVANASVFDKDGYFDTHGKLGDMCLSMKDKSRCFKNCIMMRLTTVDNGRRNIKVFPTGKLHVTGCKSVTELFDISVTLFGADTSTVNVVMINTNMHTGTRTSLQDLRTYVTEVCGLNCDYEVERYSGLKVHLEGGTLLAHGCGSFTFTGAVKAQTIYNTCHDILDFYNVPRDKYCKL